MVAPGPQGRLAESLSGIYLVDSLCDEFESEWLRGRCPRIEDFLQRAQQPHVQQLFAELVRVDLFYRHRVGDSRCVDDYLERFPEYSGLLPSTLAESPSGSGETASGVQNRCIGDYELRERIGVGSFGTVWRAWHRHLDRVDAIKLPLNRFDGRDQVEAFHHEARAAARLNHPHIVRVIGFGEWNDAGYIIFEYIEGVTLKQWRRNEGWEHRSAAELCEKLADALSHAHELNIVHRDLKPGNILIDGAGEPHVADFGLAKRLDIESTIASAGALMGTIPYMSPEQVAADHSSVGPLTDVYSLGVILYELLAGSLPFRGDRSVIMNDILHRDPPSLRGRDQSIPVALETICFKALQKDPAARYQTAADMRDDLHRYLQGQPVRARRTTLLERVSRWGRQHPVMLAIRAAAVVLSLTTLAVFAAETRDDGKWEVHVVTDPGATTVVIHSVHPDTLAPIGGSTFKGSTPVNLRLAPGKYRILATIHQNGGEQFKVAYREVPERPQRVDHMSLRHNFGVDWQRIDRDTIMWIPITISGSR